MADTKFYGKVVDGKMQWDYPQALKGFFQQEKLQGKRMVVSIKKEGKNPSLDQWGYLYGSVYNVLSEASGYTVNEVDDLMKREFVKAVGIQLPEGFIITKAFFERHRLSQFIDFVRNKGAMEWGAFTPEPNPLWKQMKEKENDKV